MRLSIIISALCSVATCLEQIPLAPTPPADLYNELEELARIVDISYCVGTANTGISQPFSCLSRCSEFPSFELVTTWNSGPLMTDSCGYIALSHSPATPRILVVFRGTYSIANTVLDLTTTPQEYLPYPPSNSSAPDQPTCANCSVHSGFYTSFLAARDLILPELEPLIAQHPDYALTLVGHSLGGAVAALAGLSFLDRGWHPTVTTFGQPKLGNAALAKFVDARYGLSSAAGQGRLRRVTHRDDPVVLLPPTEWEYWPHAGEVFINKTSLPAEAVDLVLCNGAADIRCSAGQDVSVTEQEMDMVKRSVEAGATDNLHANWAGFSIPPRYKLWQLMFAHRDYFYRLGVCLPPMGPWMPWQG